MQHKLTFYKQIGPSAAPRVHPCSPKAQDTPIRDVDWAECKWEQRIMQIMSLGLDVTQDGDENTLHGT